MFVASYSASAERLTLDDSSHEHKRYVSFFLLGFHYFCQLSAHHVVVVHLVKKKKNNQMNPFMYKWKQTIMGLFST